MAYIVIDIFSDDKAAEERAEAYKELGRNIRVVKTNGITINDCTVGHCVVKHDQDGNPLYIVISEG